MSEQNEDELNPKEKFLFRYISFAVVVFALLGLWVFYMQTLLDRFRAGEIEFIAYYVLKYEWTPIIMQVTNGAIIAVGIVLMCLAWREQYGQVPTKEKEQTND